MVPFCLLCFFSTCPDLLLFPIFVFFFLFVSCFFVLFHFALFFLFSSDFYNSFSHLKRLSLVNCFVYLFVCLFVFFLELKSWGKKSQSHCFSPVRKRFIVLLIYCYFNKIFRFILCFTIFVATHFIISLF